MLTANKVPMYNLQLMPKYKTILLFQRLNDRQGLETISH